MWYSIFNQRGVGIVYMGIQILFSMTELEIFVYYINSLYESISLSVSVLNLKSIRSVFAFE
jgi:hypothetical protein